MLPLVGLLYQQLLQALVRGCHMQEALGKQLVCLGLVEPYHIALLYVCSFLEKKAAAGEVACRQSCLLCVGNRQLDKIYDNTGVALQISE